MRVMHDSQGCCRTKRLVAKKGDGGVKRMIHYGIAPIFSITLSSSLLFVLVAVTSITAFPTCQSEVALTTGRNLAVLYKLRAGTEQQLKSVNCPEEAAARK